MTPPRMVVPDDWTAEQALAAVDLLLAIVTEIDRVHGAAMRRRTLRLDADGAPPRPGTPRP